MQITTSRAHVEAITNRLDTMQSMSQTLVGHSESWGSQTGPSTSSDDIGIGQTEEVDFVVQNC